MKRSISLFIILNTLDYLTTKISLGLGAIEFNPIADYFIRHNLFVAFKIMMILVFVYVILLIYSKRSEKRARRYVYLANLILTLVVLWNTYVLIVQKTWA